MDFLGVILDNIDTATVDFSSAAYDIVSSEIVPFLRALFVLYVMFYGLQLLMGTSKVGVSEVVLRIVRAFFILILVSNFGDFDDIIFSWLGSVPENVGRAMLTAIGGGTAEPTSGLSDVWRLANQGAGKLSEQAGVFSVLPALYGFIVIAAAGLFIAVAFAILLIAKIFVALLVAIAPIFIALFLFQNTRNYAMGWLNQLILYSILPLLVFTVAAFLISAIQNEFGAIESNITSGTLTLTEFASFILISFAGAFVMLQIQTVASAIAGTISSGVGAFGVGLTAIATRGAIRGARSGGRLAAAGVARNANQLDSAIAARTQAQSAFQNQRVNS